MAPNHCQPWLPLGEDYQQRNVSRLQKDTRSILWLYRRLIQLRRIEPALAVGDHVPMRSRHGVLLHKRAFAGREILIALNIMPDPRFVESRQAGRLLLSTCLDNEDIDVKSPFLLRGGEGVIVRI